MRELINIITEAGLTAGELGKHSGRYLKTLLSLATQGPVDVVPAAQKLYGTQVELSADTIQGVASAVETGEIGRLPKAPVFVVGGKEVKGSWGALQKSAAYTGIESKKAYNAGHLAELFMGLAVSAKFFNGGEPISVDQMIDMFQFAQVGQHQDREGRPTTNVQFDIQHDIHYTDVKGKNDNLHFKGVIPGVSAQEFLRMARTREFADDIAALLASAALFVNESQTMANSVERVKTDKNSNQIAVTSDGTTDAKMTKADLVLRVDGEKINLFSLKTYSTPTLGQISGTRFEALAEWFSTSFDLDIDEYQDWFDPALSKEQLHDNVFRLYDEVIYPQVEAEVEDQKPNKEAKIIQQLARSANMHARGSSMEDVEVVKLDDSVKSGGYKVLKFSDTIAEAMKKLDLHTRLIRGNKGRTIQILVEPAESLGRGRVWANLLCQFRSQLMGGYLRNYYEIGDIMVELTDISKTKSDDIDADELPHRTKIRPPGAKRERERRGYTKSEEPRQRR